MSDNVARITPYYMEYSLDCGEHGEMERFIRFFETANSMFRHAAEMYAFDDCNPIEIHCIVMDGVDCDYVGWMPGMRFQFRNCETREIVFDECFPKWDH